MICGGIATAQVEAYLHARAWLTDTARPLDLTPESLTTELLHTMTAHDATKYVR